MKNIYKSLLWLLKKKKTARKITRKLTLFDRSTNKVVTKEVVIEKDFSEQYRFPNLAVKLLTATNKPFELKEARPVNNETETLGDILLKENKNNKITEELQSSFIKNHKKHNFEVCRTEIYLDKVKQILKD